METPKKMVVCVVKRYAVREAEKWRYAVRTAKIGRYALRKGEGVSPSRWAKRPTEMALAFINQLSSAKEF